jgi:hypothetical protein
VSQLSLEVVFVVFGATANADLNAGLKCCERFDMPTRLRASPDHQHPVDLARA